MTKSNAPDESTTPKSFAMYAATRQRRKQKRHKHSGAGTEIGDLNITPMLDMMTILLVFLLKSYAVSSENVNVANLVLPHSSTSLNIEEAVQLMLTKDAILVDQRVVTELRGGDVRVEDLPDGPQGYLIRPLYDALEINASKLKRIEEFGGSQFSGRIAVIADKNAPYGLLFRVLYTCGRAEFGRFKLFVQKPS